MVQTGKGNRQGHLPGAMKQIVISNIFSTALFKTFFSNKIAHVD